MFSSQYGNRKAYVIFLKVLRYKSAKGEDQTNELYIDSMGSAFFFISAIMDGCVRPECPHRSNRSNTEDN